MIGTISFIVLSSVILIFWRDQKIESLIFKKFGTLSGIDDEAEVYCQWDGDYQEDCILKSIDWYSRSKSQDALCIVGENIQWDETSILNHCSKK